MEPTDRDIVFPLYRISAVTHETENPSDALERILKVIVDEFTCSSASISLMNPDTGMLVIEAQEGVPEVYQDLALPLSYGITGWVALHGKPRLVSNVEEEARYFNINQSVCSEMAAPMEISGMVIGVINVDTDRVNGFDEKDLEKLTALAEETIRVMNQVWRLEQLRLKTSHLESLVKTGQTLVSQLDLEAILKNITQETRRIMNCRLCAIYMLTPDKKKLKLDTISGVQGEIDYQEEFELGDSAVGVAIARKKQIEVLNLARTEEHHAVPLIRTESLKSLLSSPIIYDDEVIGVINAYTKEMHRFNNDEKKLFAALASLGAVAIKNADLYSRVFVSEENLRKNERLTTLGLLAAEIAHEIRNPLTVIKLLFESLGLDFKEADPRKQDLHIILEKLNHLEEIVERVLNFGKSNEALYTRCSLNQLVEETLRLVRIKLEQSKVSVDCQVELDSVYVEVHKGQVQQVLLNLIINALQAMPDGGDITIKLSTKTIENERYAMVHLTDTGQGIPDEIQTRIFDSFLSGKREGSGLGLSIAKRILKSHRGDIELVESSEGGTSFRFWLPQV